MREKPILFSAPMVRAILSGSKSQTRRIVKLPAEIAAEPDDTASAEERNDMTRLAWLSDHESGPGFYGWMTEYPEEGSSPIRCPYGKPGERLWVRENGWERPERTPKMMREGADTWDRYYFDADGYDDPADREQLRQWGFKRRPSIHMPRWASRLTLEITGVRVERLQDISDDDALAEGVRMAPDETDMRWNPLRAYRDLWQSINGLGSWDANPWVWVVEFKRANGG